MASFDCGFVHPFRQWFESSVKRTISVPDMWLPRKAAYTLCNTTEASSEEFVVAGHDCIQCMLEDFGAHVLEDKPVCRRGRSDQIGEGWMLTEVGEGESRCRGLGSVHSLHWHKGMQVFERE